MSPELGRGAPVEPSIGAMIPLIISTSTWPTACWMTPQQVEQRGKMMELARGIAHVSFVGGGVFLPARDPYDRQTLIEHVTQRVRARGRVQVLVDNHRWLVQEDATHHAATCALCGQDVDAACYSNMSNGAAYCVQCALGGPTRAELSDSQEWRQVG